MDDQRLFPAASSRDTLRYCWQQMAPERPAFVGAWVAIALGTLANAVAGPLIFATLLGRIADLRGHTGLWARFGPLVVAYAVTLAAATLLWRLAGWVNWGATLRAFARSATTT